MRRRGRRQSLLAGLDPLETRSLLSAAAYAVGDVHAEVLSNVPGNTGLIVHSQIDPAGNNTVGYQWWKLTAGRPVVIRTDPAVDTPGAADPFIGALNTGLVSHSQFVAGAFPQIGLQLGRVRLGGGLTVDAVDQTSAVGASSELVGAPVNTGDVVHSQFNRGGFGKTGLQLDGAAIRGDLTLQSRILMRAPDGRPSGPATASTAAEASAAPPVDFGLTNSGLIRGSQFNDGGFGDVGLQWRRVRVGGSVGLGVEKYVVDWPGATTTAVATPDAPPGNENLPSIDTVNVGSIRDTQFNAGGFGDIGLQWSGVKVHGNAGTSDNNLYVQPTVDHQGPLTVDGLVFGQATSAADTGAVARTAAPRTMSAARRTAPRSLTTEPVENDSLNSGRIAHSQFNDGGFGDFGAQWRGVAVKGNVSAVHNSLAVEPRNTDQGVITVKNVVFPSETPASLTPTPHPRPGRRVEPAPPVVERDGRAVPHTLFRPTRPNETRFQVDEATNSGLVRNSQFSDGGFGDVGLQWSNVRVGGDVKSVHNSLSIQPKGSKLQGVVVDNVSFGAPLPAGAEAAAVPFDAASALRSAASPAARAVSARHAGWSDNTMYLDHQQFLRGPSPNVLFQWNHAYRDNGLVIVHNKIVVPASGSVTLNDIRFLGVNPTAADAAPRPSAAAVFPAAGDDTQVVNSATNSGIVWGNQFSDGGFRGVGLQWRDVKVSGSVTVVRNTLSVNVTDEPTGPITVSNVTFNSGALDRVRPTDQTVVWPPDSQNFIHARLPVGRPLPQRPDVVNSSTNSGTLYGGQFQVGGVDTPHVDLQWRKAAVRGSVTIIDNVLLVSPPPAGSGPITIQHVLFA